MSYNWFLDLGESNMVGQLLIRGLIVGLIAGVLAFAIGRVYGEVSFDHAITYEGAKDARERAEKHKVEVEKAKAAGLAAPAEAAEEPDLFSRDTQKNLGLPVGTIVVGAALGGIFSLVFAFAYGRLWNMGPRGTSAILALFGFISLFLIPNLKFPSNPPGTSETETIGARTALYFSMIALSVIAIVLSVMLRSRLVQKLGSWNASIVAGIAYVVVVGIVMALLPSVMETPADFSAVDMWNFRVSTIAMQAMIYAVIGLAFGALAERVVAGPRTASVGTQQDYRRA